MVRLFKIAVRKGLDARLPDCGGPQDLSAGKLHQRVIGIINVAENRSPALSGRLFIELVRCCPSRWGLR